MDPTVDDPRRSPTQATTLDALCSRFEQACDAAEAGGPAPSVADFVLALPEPERPAARTALEAVAGRRGVATTAAAERPDGPPSTVGPSEPPATLPATGVHAPADDATGAFAPAGDRHGGTTAPDSGRSPHGDTANWTAFDAVTGTHESGGSSAARPAVAGPGRWAGLAPEGYTILGELGRGGMGVVYRARQLKADRLVALKMILAGAHASRAQLERFEAEARAAARVQHPGVVQLFEVGEKDGLPFFSLEYVDGGTLAERLADKPLDFREAAALLLELARGLGAAHDRNVIHRDIKPANILLTPEGHPKITDFGLARQLDGDSRQTHTGAVMGTPSYMAPEQAWGRTDEIGKPADIYGLGAVLYQALTGRPPFHGTTTVETLDLVRSQEPVPPSQLRPKLPVDLETVCLKCLQKEPARRYASAAALADDLEAFLDGRPIKARPVGTLVRGWRWARRHRALAAALAAVALLLVTVAAVSTASALGLKALSDSLADQNARLVLETERANDNAEGERVARLDAQAKERQAVEAQGREAQARGLAETREKEARAAAEEAFRQNGAALESIRFLTVLAFDRLKAIPGTAAVRRELLDTAADRIKKYTDGLRNVTRSLPGADPTLPTRTLAGLYSRNAEMMLGMNRVGDALDQYRTMEGLVRGLRDRYPNEMTSQRNFAAAQNLLGLVYLDRLGDAERALAHFQAGLEARLRRHQIAPDDNSRWDLASQHGYLGRAELALGRPSKAVGHYREERRWREQLSPAFAGQVRIRREFAGMLEKTGEALLRDGQADAGLAAFKEARAVRDDVNRVNVDPATRLHDQWFAVAQRGNVRLLHLRDNPGALADYEEALSLLRTWLEQNPDHPQANTPRADLATNHYGLGVVLTRLGRTAEADAHFAECLKLRRRLATDPKVRMDEIDLMAALARCGQIAESGRIARGLLVVPPQDARIYYQAALGYALAAGAAARQAPADPEPAGWYTGLAVDALRKAVAGGWRDRVTLETDPDLDPVRHDPGFLAAAASAGASKPTPAR